MNNKEKQELVKRSVIDLFQGARKSLVMKDVFLDVFSDGLIEKTINELIFECMSIWAEVMKEYTSLLNETSDGDRTLTFSIKDLTEHIIMYFDNYPKPKRVHYDKETLDEINSGDIIGNFKKKIDNGDFDDTPRELEKSENFICLSCKNRKPMITSGAGGKGVSRWTKCIIDEERKVGVTSCVNYTKF